MILALTKHNGLRLAEVGLLLMVFAGAWMVAADIPQLGLSRGRGIVAGAALAIGGLLLIIAAHWGHFS